jgi:hypothetical protein
MSKTDDFDKFLKSRFQKTEYHIADEGFTERVISNLPTNRLFPIKRNFILYLSSTLSVLIFFISSGYKSLLISIIEILTNGFHLIKPSFISFVVILVFIGVSLYIARIEHDKNLI